MPLAQLLREQGLSGPLREVIMYALACIGTDQERFCSGRLPAQGDAELGSAGADSSRGAEAPNQQSSTSTSAASMTHSSDAPASSVAAQQARPHQPGSAGEGLSAAVSAPQDPAACGQQEPDVAPVSVEVGLALLRQYLASVGR